MVPMSSARIAVPNFEESDMAGPKAEDLAQRRQLLKAKRKTKFYKMAWRTFLTTAIAVGSVKLATSPIWLIRSADQIDVSDNQRLPAESVRTLVPVSFPQSLVSIQPEELAEHLASYPPIEAAIVRRRLIPPRLHVEIIEKVPVAIALPALGTTTQENNPQISSQQSSGTQSEQRQSSQTPSEQPIPFTDSGLLDAQGYWMPRDSFSDLGATADPSLQVIGIRAEDINAWQMLYKEVARSPVEITVIDWSDQDNLILHSDLGKVHLGPYSSQLAAQLAALDQLRALNKHTPPEQVAYIRLQDPENPIVEVLQAADATSDKTSEPSLDPIQSRP